MSERLFPIAMLAKSYN